MNLETLEYATRLAGNIRRTEDILDGLRDLQSSRKTDRKDNDIDDGQYFLAITAHKDGSGLGADMSRYLGNAEVVDAVLEIVERQLQDQKKEFAEL